MSPQEQRGFVRRFHRDADGREARYSLFVPPTYSAEVSWPLLLFLHGAGETGTDGVSPTRVGLGPAILRQAATFPFLVVFPQSQRGSWQAQAPDGRRAMAILDEVRRAYTVDAGRVHLTGISMGGIGTWSLAAEHPGVWASIVPVCGGGDPRQAARIRHIPCWAFHGEADDVIPVSRSREMIEALRAAGGDPKYMEFPGVDHNSWDLAYALPELYTWLAGQRRRERR